MEYRLSLVECDDCDDVGEGEVVHDFGTVGEDEAREVLELYTCRRDVCGRECDGDGNPWFFCDMGEMAGELQMIWETGQDDVAYSKNDTPYRMLIGIA